ncbi:acetyl-CoA hydrolase/transferase family protein [Paramaledivibacter caminithermalis]|jgi:acyl-CoA hydrolase|uniref:Acyl-CoA hydrolase n=1 Tax=Paramaledivibacter caminithermalis (strain DSM 15212 / CIP 107654 / DViRD3) TaxID=1121301 RepID=A0A1M6TH55_PARC5|nr:acetyl-CoA hydrolase/transferase C-terminal domain-containing protein [Paramaledivibacter caminithermalis]SHK56108.1 Acyl-CoA hydrolase [Paramaledivibacter caminithermalis DSM 15212]
MNTKEIYKSKLITIEEALSKIKTGDNIVSALSAAEPREILSKLHTIAHRVKDVNVVTCLPLAEYEYFSNPKYKDSFFMEGWFYSPEMRKAHKNGNVSFIPNHLHFAASKRLVHRKTNIFLGTASTMDKHGFLSLSLSATYEREMIENADIVILEVNPNMPRTFGDTIIHISEVDFVVEVDYKVPEIPILKPSEKDRIIGKYIADLVEDGSTIQLGIGGIPNAVAAELMNKKDLGIHTEMFTDGMVDLYEAGVITGKKKTLLSGKMVAAFALGTKKLYNFIDDNPQVNIIKGSWVNDPYIIGQNYKMVSINTTLEIDLTGQCCSESIGHIQFSGTGGQADTAIGAQNSKGGKSIIALHSTAKVKVSNDNERKEISKIVTRLTRGAVVSLSRNDVDFVVTEYGVAALRGTSIRDRVKRLIDIAHPDFRDSLREEAKELMIW